MGGELFETFCFADEWTFVPDHFAYSVEHIPSKVEALKYMEDGPRGLALKALEGCRLGSGHHKAVGQAENVLCGST